MPCCSSTVGLAVPISKPLYTVHESAQITSPFSFLASLIDSAVLPLAVSPTITTIGLITTALALVLKPLATRGGCAYLLHSDHLLSSHPPLSSAEHVLDGHQGTQLLVLPAYLPLVAMVNLDNQSGH